MNWKYIEQYGTSYMINAEGTIVSLARNITLRNGKTRRIRTRTIKPRINNYGYLSVRLSKDGVSKTHFVHRLLAQAFIPNVNSYSQVNHISGNKLDNSLQNLEWVNASQNAIHAYENQLTKNQGRDHAYSASIIDTESKFIFPTIKAFCKFYNIKYSTGRNMLNGNIQVPKSLDIDATKFIKVYNGNRN